MPTATIDNKAINPPYQPHTQSNSYNFHSSIYYYAFISSPTVRHAIRTGDTLFLYWEIFGSSGVNASVVIRCKVPAPGAH